jgi:hypothetical protein
LLFSWWLPFCLGWDRILILSWFAFLLQEKMLGTFHVFIGHLCFFWKGQFFCLFINWVICLVFKFFIFLYILDINPLSDE